MSDLGCCGSTNWATFSVSLAMKNSYYWTTVDFAMGLDHPADETDARDFFEYAMGGKIPDGAGPLVGEREIDIDFDELAADLRSEQCPEHLRNLGASTDEVLAWTV